LGPSFSKIILIRSYLLDHVPIRIEHDRPNQNFVCVKIKPVFGTRIKAVFFRAPCSKITPLIDAVLLDPIVSLLDQFNRAIIRPDMDFEFIQSSSEPIVMEFGLFLPCAGAEALFDLESKTSTLFDLFQTQQTMTKMMTFS